MSREVEEEELVMMDIEEEERRTSTTSSGGNSRRRREEEAAVRRLEDNVDLTIPIVGGGGSLRVLLLEGDDSTRHIITALLRKCHYKVTAVSDGLKAWEILKERPQSIDVVLTEVELSLISGISLLSMIMGHESCKNIPVIMMSSNDSINMVFKCMLKGAADFLVKPVRKNELRNLWQHVWRKRTISDGHGGAKGHNDDNAKNRLEANPRKAKKSSAFLPLVEVNIECSEKGSDAESSCRRSDMEAESTYKQNSTEPEQIKCGGLSPLSDSLCQNGEERIQPNSSLLGKEIKDEDCSNMLGSEFTRFNGRCMANEQLLEEEHPCALVDATNEDMKPIGSIYDSSATNGDQTCEQSTPPKQIIDLIGEINNQGQFGYGLGRNTSSSNNPNDATEVVFHGEDFSCKSSSSPMLELSLRRYPYGTVDEEKEKACSALNHSNSSPFSLYNGRPPAPPLSRIANLEGEGGEFYSHSTKQIPDKGFGNSSNVLGCNGTTPNIEDVEPPSFGASSQDGNTVKCSPIRVIPVSIPVGGVNFDIGARYHSGMQSIFYPDPSAHLLWNAFQIEGQKAGHMSSSRQSDTKDIHSSHQHPHNQTPKSPILYQIEHMTEELRDNECHVTCVTEDSANGSTCHGSASQIESNGLGRIFHVNNANNNAMKINNVTAELQNQEEKKPAELHCLNHREAALKKFRLKRKDRCFEKKVRYQSRKRLAEQRPRVKGQFVRHIQPGALLASAELAGSY